MGSREPERPVGRPRASVPGAGETTDAVPFEGEPIAEREESQPPEARPARRGDTVATARERGVDVPPLDADDEVLELREERLVARKEMRQVGEVVVRTQIDEVPGRLEAEALREEVEIDHIPVGEAVTERVRPWEEDGALFVPVYEEQLVLVKRLVLREKIRIRRVQTRERRVFQDTLKKERLIVEDEGGSGLVHERYPAVGRRDAADPNEPLLRAADRPASERESGGLLGNLVRKVLE
ncbi:MAG TPA: YsnF/AvaK domain-containing protein [Chloroflexota bacterium]|nr:YsnF/AvaK domain-containing protein [Chloroflexota bacterium]